MYLGQFYNFSELNGNKMMVNINNIAFMTPHEHGVKVTLNVKDKSGSFIEFVARQEYNSSTNDIYGMDQNQRHNQDNQED